MSTLHRSWLLLLSVVVVPLQAAPPPQYYLDEEGNELLLVRDDEVPYGALRVITPSQTLLISGDLADAEGPGELSFVMPDESSLEEGAEERGWKVLARPDSAKSRAVVQVMRYGSDAEGLAQQVPGADGLYRRVKAEERLGRAQQENQSAEVALAAARDRVASVEHAGLKEILKGQAIWQEERLAAARMVAESVDGDRQAEEVPDYWQTMAELCRMRTDLLLAASGLDAPAGRSGRYVDDAGGLVAIGAGEKTLRFDIQVVRGPTFHTGAIAGTAEWKEPDLAVFVDGNEEAFDDGAPAELRFRFRGHELEIEAEHTSFYHGARAYFEGTYYHAPD